MTESKTIQKIYRWRIKSAPLAIIPCLILARPNPVSLAAGVGISLLGLLFRAWASMHIRKDEELAVSGPYRYTRNPLYFGNFILGVSLVVGSRSWWVAAIFGVYFAIFYPVALLVEKSRMEKAFPGQYGEYQKRVPLFIPSLRSSSGPQSRGFCWKLYGRNREYRALIGSTVIWILMTVRMLLFG